MNNVILKQLLNEMDKVTPEHDSKLNELVELIINKVNNPINEGTIINNVHHPSKKILISVISRAFNPNITPTAIKTNPHKKLLTLFIKISFSNLFHFHLAL